MAFLSGLLRGVIGEFFAAFIFLSTVMSMLVNSSRALDPIMAGTLAPGIVVAFVATAVVFAFADVSGAHFNPAVTTGFIVTCKIHPIKGLLYIVAQLAAGVSAAAFMFAIFPNNIKGVPTIQQVIPATVPSTTPVWQAVMMEFFLTFLLVYVIFSTAVDEAAPPKYSRVELESAKAPAASGESAGESTEGGRDIEAPPSPAAASALANANIEVFSNAGPSKNSFAAIAIGFTLGFLCFLGGSSSGGAFNPARVFGPAVVTNTWADHWVYWAGDLAGGAFAGLIHTFLFSRASGLLGPSLSV